MKIIIIGGGQVGSYLSSLLWSNGHDLQVIEHRKVVYDSLLKQLPADRVLLGNGSDPAVLEKAGITSAEVVAAVTEADEINLVVSTLAKMEFGVPRVVALVNNPNNSWLYNSGMGVDVGVNQAEVMAHIVVEEMSLNDMFTILKLSRGNYSIIQMQVHQNAKAVARRLKELPLSRDMLLIAIMRGEALIIPKGDTPILAGDEILALADEAGRSTLEEILSEPRNV